MNKSEDGRTSCKIDRVYRGALVLEPTTELLGVVNTVVITLRAAGKRE